MKVILKTFLYFYFLIFLVWANYDCNSGTVYVQPYEISFFETTNYPVMMSIEDFGSCNLTFILNSSNTDRYTGYVGHSQNFIFDDNNQMIANILTFDSSTFSIEAMAGREIYLAQQGQIIFFDSNNDGCTWELLNPLKLTDESQIAYIDTSAFDLNRTCNWIFTAPNEYGFKIVFIAFTPTDRLLIKNSTQIFINERSAEIGHPIYNPDKYLHIFLDQQNIDNVLAVYISIVKKNVEKRNGSCILAEKGNTSSWENNPINSFENNVRCFISINIPENHILQIDFESLKFEEGIDYLRYYFEESESVFVTSDYGATSIFVQTEKDSIKNMSWEFVSDGSFNSVGFQIGFSKFECKCASPIIPCDGQDYSIMENTGIFCGNLNCTFVISPCPSKMSLMTLKYSHAYHHGCEYIFIGDPRVSLMGHFNVISNGSVILEINNDNANHLEFFAYFSSANINIFEAVTYYSSEVNCLLFSTQSYESNVHQFLHELLGSHKNFKGAWDRIQIDSIYG